MNRGIHVLYASNGSIENGEDMKGFCTHRYRQHNSSEKILFEQNSMRFDDESFVDIKQILKGTFSFENNG